MKLFTEVASLVWDIISGLGWLFAATGLVMYLAGHLIVSQPMFGKGIVITIF